MGRTKFIAKFILFSLIFSSVSPTFSMNEPVTNGLSNMVTSPKTIPIALGLLGATCVLYKIFGYYRKITWRNELQTLIPTKQAFSRQRSYGNLNNTLKATELLKKINDKKLNSQVSYWTQPLFEKTLHHITEKEIVDEKRKKIIINLTQIDRKAAKAKNYVNELFNSINDKSTHEIYCLTKNKPNHKKDYFDNKIETAYINATVEM